MKFVLESILVRVPYILMVLSIFIIKVDRPITCFYVCVLYVLYDSWVSTDLSVSIKTTTTTTVYSSVMIYFAIKMYSLQFVRKLSKLEYSDRNDLEF